MHEASSVPVTPQSHWRDYVELTKPKVVALMMLTAIVGMQMASPGFVPMQPLILGSIGIWLAASSAAVINHLVDRRIDLLMSRTQHRPIASGRVSVKNALIFAIFLAVIAMAILIEWVNSLTAILTFATLIGYAGVYTLYLKRATPQNIVIGGAAGAAPPLLGWVAVTGQVTAEALLLVLIIFIWTPPHFWALAIYRRDEYAKANIPMLPATHGVAFTKLSVLLYTVLLTAVSMLPFAIGMSGWIYLSGILLLDAGFLYWAILLMISTREIIAMKTFKYSIYYLMGLFLILLVDHIPY